MPENESEVLSQSFVYLVSARGGNNYWARLLNGCDKIAIENYGTMSVGVSDNGRFVLRYDPAFVERISPRILKLALIHEAIHIALRHQERLYRILSTITDPELRLAVLAIFNIAADLSANDAALRLEEGFDGTEIAPTDLQKLMAHRTLWDKGGPVDDFPWLLPEHMQLPKGLSFESYVLKIAKKAKPIAKAFMKALEKMNGEGEGQDDGQPQPNGGSGGGSGDGDEEGSSKGSGGGSGQSKSSKGDKGKDKGPASFSADPDDSISDDMQDLAKNNKPLLESMMAGFQKMLHDNHREWIEKAKSLTSDEATSIANKMKGHAKQLAKSAYEQTIKARGFVPGHIQGLVAPLLKDEQMPWHWFFSDCVQSQISSKVIEAMSMPNLSMINDQQYEPWPGQTLDPVFRIDWLTDTSGSVGDAEFARAMNVMNALMSQNRNIILRHIQCDAQIQKEEMTDNLQPPDESVAHTRAGYGGTVYTPAFRRICGCDTGSDWVAGAQRLEEPPTHPDLLVVFTDGAVGIEGEVLPKYHPGCPIIWLVAPNCEPALGMSDVPPDHIIKMFPLED